MNKREAIEALRADAKKLDPEKCSLALYSATDDQLSGVKTLEANASREDEEYFWWLADDYPLTGVVIRVRDGVVLKLPYWGGVA